MAAGKTTKTEGVVCLLQLPNLAPRGAGLQDHSSLQLGSSLPHCLPVGAEHKLSALSLLCTNISWVTASNSHLIILKGNAEHKANPLLCPLRLSAGSCCREAATGQPLAVDLPHSLGLGDALEGELPNVAQLDVRDGLAPLILQGKGSCGRVGCRGPDNSLAPSSCRTKAAPDKRLQGCSVFV